MDKEINVDGTHSHTFKQGDYLHHFVLGATGKSSLSKLCGDYKKRSTGDLRFASNKHWSFANVKVTSEAMTVTVYERVKAEENGKSYAELYTVKVEQWELNKLKQIFPF